MTTLEIVEQGTILRATVGSTVHGLHHSGQDDRDEMAVFIEPPEYLVGLRLARRPGVRNAHRFEHWVERTQPEGVRSGPGDLDLVAYSLRKYVRLALKGHPTVLLLLFVPDELTQVETELGRRLRQLLPAMLSRRAGRGYLGYLRGQKERLLGTRGLRVSRPELVEAHGFDTKYAMHALRLGYQGLELTESGRVTLPMPEPERARVLAVRHGERSFDEACREIDDVEHRLEAALERTTLPDDPDEDVVNAFLVEAYRRAWGW
jgi:predicted nucleotidyltransferase